MMPVFVLKGRHGANTFLEKRYDAKKAHVLRTEASKGKKMSRWHYKGGLEEYIEEQVHRSSSSVFLYADR